MRALEKCRCMTVAESATVALSAIADSATRSPARTASNPPLITLGCCTNPSAWCAVGCCTDTPFAEPFRNPLIPARYHADTSANLFERLANHADISTVTVKERFGNASVTVNSQLNSSAGVTGSSPKSGHLSGIGTSNSTESGTVPNLGSFALADVCNGLQRNATRVVTHRDASVREASRGFETHRVTHGLAVESPWVCGDCPEPVRTMRTSRTCPRDRS